MVVRHHQIDFASGALVFPGGKVDTQDDDPELAPLCDGASEDPVLRAIEIGSIREAFEEAGVLLARAEGEAELLDGARVACPRSATGRAAQRRASPEGFPTPAQATPRLRCSHSLRPLGNPHHDAEAL